MPTFGNEKEDSWQWWRRGGGKWGGAAPLPSRLEGLGNVVNSPSRVRGGAWP